MLRKRSFWQRGKLWNISSRVIHFDYTSWSRTVDNQYGRSLDRLVDILHSNAMFAYRLYMLVSTILVMTILTQETENARSGIFQYGQKRQAVSDVRKYCGSSLSSTLQIICDGTYNSRFKKSNQDMEMNDYAFSYDLHPYKSIENARKMIRFRRDSRGIYEECCLKSCSTEELRSYCGAR